MPGFGIDGFSHATYDAERAQVGLFYMLLTQAAEEADCCRSSIEVGELMLVDSLPEARGGWVYWRGFEDGGGDTVCKRAVDKVAINGVSMIAVP